MCDIRRQKTLKSELDIGMYVCELDRPWLGTPFMLEGLLLEDQAQISQIASLCEFVYIDRTVSVGAYTSVLPKENLADKNDADVIIKYNVNAYSPKTNAPTKLKDDDSKFSFFAILKEIQASNRLAKSGNENKNSPSDDVDVKIKVKSGTNAVDAHVKANYNDESTSLLTQMRTDFSQFISRLYHRKTKPKKLTSSIDQVSLKLDIQKRAKYARERGNILISNDAVEYEIAEIYPIYEQSQIATREIFESIALNKEIDLSNINLALDGMVDSIERNPDALIWLSKLKQSDDIAYNHALNVSITLMAFSSFLSLPKKQVKDLGLAGLLQDVGKSKIPHEILHKTEKITDAEFELLKKHVEYAMNYIKTTANISSAVMLTVSQHHERLDGSGYPEQLSGNQISLSGQMAGLVDCYCALTTNKVYAKGIYNHVALEEIQTLRDTQFNGVLIDHLVQFLGIYPVSSLVELNSGEVAVVIQQNSVRRLLPRVMVLLNPDKSKNAYPATIDLINAPLAPNGEVYKIVCGLPADSYDLSAGNYYG